MRLAYSSVLAARSEPGSPTWPSLSSVWANAVPLAPSSAATPTAASQRRRSGAVESEGEVVMASFAGSSGAEGPGVASHFRRRHRGRPIGVCPDRWSAGICASFDRLGALLEQAHQQVALALELPRRGLETRGLLLLPQGALLV